MKKILILALAVVMCLAMLAGCGKSEEEKARDELQDALQSEMGEDAYNQLQDDLKDAAEYEKELQEKAEEQAVSAEAKQAAKAEVDENELADFQEAVRVYQFLTNWGMTEDGEPITKEGLLSAMDAFNTSYDAFLEKAVSTGAYTEDEAQFMISRAARTNKISETERAAFSIYMDSIANLDCEGVAFVANKDAGEFYFYVSFGDPFDNADNYMNGRIIRADGTTCDIDLTGDITNVAYVNSIDFDNNKIVLGVQHEGSDLLYYTVDITSDKINVTSGGDPANIADGYETFIGDAESMTRIIYDYFAE